GGEAGARAAEPGRPELALSPEPEPPSARPARTRSRAARPATEGAGSVAASAVRTEDHDPIELPVSTPNKAALRIVIALVGAVFLFFVIRALRHDDAGADPTPPAAEAPSAATAAPPAA
ncbi:hypothetical protein BE20_47480, partial [Sorangium cellulosum]